MSNRLFTLTEARSVLPEIRERLGRAMRISNRMRTFSGELEALAGGGILNSGSAQGTLYVEHLVALEDCVEEIQEMGCLVQSVEEGEVETSSVLHWPVSWGFVVGVFTK